VLRDGAALTPLVLWALRGEGAGGKAAARGLRWLEKLTDAQMTKTEAWAGLAYPLFTASYAVQAFAQARDAERMSFWCDLVERLRISAELGWPASAVACGAWSDASTPPRLPAGETAAPDMFAPNISATVLGLQALVAARRDKVCAAAQPFLAQCQNFSAKDPTRFDDGGFFFAPGDPVRNKAGRAGREADGRERFFSYGSATCDGILALRACGVAFDDLRMQAALGWLRHHAAGAAHGGEWAADREDERESLRYYHAQGLAGVLVAAGQLPEFATWAAEQRARLAADLTSSQRPNGDWEGICPDSFEDDPVVATAFALRALTSD
jgi:hypothetical protein